MRGFSLKKILFTVIFLLLSLDKTFSQSAPNNYLPLQIGNTYQYFEQVSVGNAFPFTGYSLSIRTVLKDTLINNHKYYFYDGPYVSDWIRYSEEDKKIYAFWNDTDRVYMDFNKALGDTFYQFYLPLHNYRISSVMGGQINIFSQLYEYRGYDTRWVGPTGTFKHGERFGENFGIYFFNDNHRDGSFETALTANVIMAIVYDSIGNAQLFSNHYKPQITITPITVLSSQNFNLSFKVTHYYNRYPYPDHHGLNFIDTVTFVSFYQQNDSIIFNPLVAASDSAYPDYKISIILDTALLKCGFSFNYKIVAKDKGIIPETSYSPDSGYYQCNWDFGTGIENNATAPKEFSLSQNYPNPFNPSTRIQYQLSNNSHVSLKVYDILGNEVATLVDEYKPAGTYEVEFQSTVGSRQLASGVYYYQLKVGENVQIKKMILLR